MTKAQILAEAYRKAYGRECDSCLIEGLQKFAEEYEFLNALEKFKQTPATIIHLDPPVRKAKQIALDVAIKIIGNGPTLAQFTKEGDEDDTSGDRTLRIAEKVYQWLVEKEKP